jgi:hypothetical protein
MAMAAQSTKYTVLTKDKAMTLTDEVISEYREALERLAK